MDYLHLRQRAHTETTAAETQSNDVALVMDGSEVVSRSGLPTLPVPDLEIMQKFSRNYLQFFDRYDILYQSNSDSRNL